MAAKCFRNLTLTILKPGTTAKRHILGLLYPQGDCFPQNSEVTVTGSAGDEGGAGKLKPIELVQW